MNIGVQLFGDFNAINSSVCSSYTELPDILRLQTSDYVCPVVPTVMAEPQQREAKAKELLYSDASSSYWAPGWNFERWSDPADLDFGDTSPEEIEKMRLGLIEVLGQDEFEEMNNWMDKNRELYQDKKMVADGIPPPEYRRPDFIRRWKDWHHGGEVGFVAFRTTLYDDEDKWAVYKERLARILSLSFDRVVRWHRWHEYEEITEARPKFKLLWIEDKALDGANAETLRERYRQLEEQKQVPISMQHYAFLCASPQAVDSVLSLESEDDFPTVESKYWRNDAPFLLAVLQDEKVDPHGEEEPYDPDDRHDERNWYKSVFKVPAELVWDELWLYEDHSLGEATRMTRNVKGSDELGGWLPKVLEGDDLLEMWWGMGPTPQALKRRAEMRRRARS